VVAVEVEDHLQCLSAALDVVEDVVVCGGQDGQGSSPQGRRAVLAQLHWCSSTCLPQVPALCPVHQSRGPASGPLVFLRVAPWDFRVYSPQRDPGTSLFPLSQRHSL
jgi:hypothetical protein